MSEVMTQRIEGDINTQSPQQEHIVTHNKTKLAQLIIATIGDVFQSGEIREDITDLCHTLASRSLYIKKPGDIVVVPASSVSTAFLNYVAKQKYKDDMEAQAQFKKEVICIDDLKGPRSQDYLQALSVHPEFKKAILDGHQSFKFIPYKMCEDAFHIVDQLNNSVTSGDVQKIVWDFADTDKLRRWGNDWGDKVLFHADCEEFSKRYPQMRIPTVPDTVIVEREYTEEERMQREVVESISVSRAFHEFFEEKQKNTIFFRKAAGGGGAENAQLERKETDAGTYTYILTIADFDSVHYASRKAVEEAIIEWNKGNEKGIVVAPLIGHNDKKSFSGTAKIEKGAHGKRTVKIMYVGEELTSKEKHSYEGFMFDKKNSQYPELYTQAEQTLYNYAMMRMGQDEDFTGIVQLDMIARRLENVENATYEMCVTESNMNRFTAVMLAFGAMADMGKKEGASENWENDVADEYEKGTIESFISCDHETIPEEFESAEQLIDAIKQYTSKNCNDIIPGYVTITVDIHRKGGEKKVGALFRSVDPAAFKNFIKEKVWNWEVFNKLKTV